MFYVLSPLAPAWERARERGIIFVYLYHSHRLRHCGITSVPEAIRHRSAVLSIANVSGWVGHHIIPELAALRSQ